MTTSIGNTPSGRPGQPVKDQPDARAEADFAEASQTDKTQAAGSPRDKSSTTVTSDFSEEHARKPRLPHEHDESSDSQKHGGTRPVMQQAHDDLESGQKDTDRGAPMHDTYRKQKTTKGSERG